MNEPTKEEMLKCLDGLEAGVCYLSSKWREISPRWQQYQTIRQLVKNQPEVDRHWVKLKAIEIVSEIVDYGAGNLGIFQALELLLPVILQEAGVKIKEISGE